MNLLLTAQEQKVLTEMLSSQRRNLEQQIVRTDYREAKAVLREREHVLESVLAKLGSTLS